MSELGPEDRQLVLEIKGQLDNLVVSIELTLVSIVQGTALGALIAVAQPPLLAVDWQVWPRILTGLLLILIFWSRAVIHTLGFIRWPLDFNHNFLYIAVTVVEVMTLNQLMNPTAWFWANTAYAVAGWVLYRADASLLARAEPEFVGPNARSLYLDMVADQRRNVRYLLPGAVAFHAVAALLPAWAFALSCVQTSFYLIYLLDGVRALRRRQGWILQQLVDQRRGRGLQIREDERGLDVGNDG